MPCHTAGPVLAAGKGEGLNLFKESIGDPGQDKGGGEGGLFIFSSISLSGEDGSFAGVTSRLIFASSSSLQEKIIVTGENKRVWVRVLN